MIVAETGLFPGDLAEGKRGLSVSSFTSFRRVARKGDLGQISQISKVFYLTYKDDAICIKSSAARMHISLFSAASSFVKLFSFVSIYFILRVTSI